MPSHSPSPHAAAPDSLALYLRDIGAYPLISPAEEARLAGRIRTGDHDALDALVRANLRFVVSVAKRYQRDGVSLADLVSEGNLGLIRAAHKFDGTRGIRFISYAVWWIRQAVVQALADQRRAVRLPVNHAAKRARIGRRVRQLEQEFGREPTRDELADGLEVSEREVADIIAAAQAPLSLDAPVADGAERRLLDVVADDDAPRPDEEGAGEALAATVAAALSALTPREARILRLYFGLDGAEPLTLDQIGARLGITRERVRQVRDKALRKIRRGRHAPALAAALAS